jgi:hypothetical protein
MMPEISEALRGPWQAFIADPHGEIYARPEDVEQDQSADVSVRRGSALPGERGTLPGSFHTGDILYEHEGLYADDEDQTIGLHHRWEQAQAVADALNRLGGATADDGKVIIDGADVSAALRGFTLHAHVGERTSCVLELAMRGTEIDGIQRLYLKAAQVGLLARFGWTLPDGYQMDADGNVLLERPADPNKSNGEPPVDHPV